MWLDSLTQIPWTIYVHELESRLEITFGGPRYTVGGDGGVAELERSRNNSSAKHRWTPTRARGLHLDG